MKCNFLFRLVTAVVLLATPAFAASWKAEGPFFGSVTSIAVDPSRPDHLWASTHGGGVWRSIDGGTTWQLSGKELSDRVVTYVTLQPKTNTLWAGVSEGGLARSKDGGLTWQWIHTDLTHPPSPAAFDTAGDIWIPNGGLHKRSSDGGENWTEFRINGVNVATFAFHPTDSKIIWAGGLGRRSGLLKSIDGGASWKQLGVGLPAGWIRELIVDPSQPNTLYMSTGAGGFKSVDGGENWAALAGMVQGAELASLTLHRSSPQTLFADTPKGFFTTADGGQTWNKVGRGLPLFDVEALAIHPASPDVMWAGTSGAGIYKTTDGGRTWTDANRGFAASWIEKVWGHPAGTMLVQTGRGLFRGDGRGTWVEILQPFSDSEAHADVVIFDAKNPTIVHAGRAGSYYRSLDAGVTWSEMNKAFQDPSPEFDTLLVDAINPKVLYSAAYRPSTGDPIIFKSIDGGVRWKAASRGVTGAGVLELQMDSAGTLLALGREGGLWRSNDGATTWSAGGKGLPMKNIEALALDPTNASRVYVAAKDDFYRSDDGGLTFSAQKLDARSVVVDVKGMVYVATLEGVSRSSDGGKTWTSFNEGLTNVDVRTLYIARSRLYAGTAGGGVFSIDVE